MSPTKHDAAAKADAEHAEREEAEREIATSTQGSNGSRRTRPKRGRSVIDSASFTRRSRPDLVAGVCHGDKRRRPGSATTAAVLGRSALFT